MRKQIFGVIRVNRRSLKTFGVRDLAWVERALLRRRRLPHDRAVRFAAGDDLEAASGEDRGDPRVKVAGVRRYRGVDWVGLDGRRGICCCQFDGSVDERAGDAAAAMSAPHVKARD